MASRVIQFVWHQSHGPGTFELKCHTTVAALSNAEWREVENVAKALQARRRDMIVNIEPTKALGGDLLDLPSTITKLENQFGLSREEDHGDDPANAVPGEGEEGQT